MGARWRAKAFDINRAGELAVESGFWPATTDAADSSGAASRTLRSAPPPTWRQWARSSLTWMAAIAKTIACSQRRHSVRRRRAKDAVVAQPDYGKRPTVTNAGYLSWQCPKCHKSVFWFGSINHRSCETVIVSLEQYLGPPSLRPRLLQRPASNALDSPRFLLLSPRQ